jgi:hypothetical protein
MVNVGWMMVQYSAELSVCYRVIVHNFDHKLSFTDLVINLQPFYIYLCLG